MTTENFSPEKNVLLRCENCCLRVTVYGSSKVRELRYMGVVMRESCGVGELRCGVVLACGSCDVGKSQ